MRNQRDVQSQHRLARAPYPRRDPTVTQVHSAHEPDEPLRHKQHGKSLINPGLAGILRSALLDLSKVEQVSCSGSEVRRSKNAHPLPKQASPPLSIERKVLWEVFSSTPVWVRS
jgi:hypothetical protein